MNSLEQIEPKVQNTDLAALKDQIDDIYCLGDSVECELYRLKKRYPATVSKLIQLMDEQMTMIAHCQHLKVFKSA